MKLKKYIMATAGTPEALVEEVEKLMRGNEEETLDPNSKVETAWFYYPHGSVICHPACPPDPGLPLRFSQPMLLNLRTMPVAPVDGIDPSIAPKQYSDEKPTL